MDKLRLTYFIVSFHDSKTDTCAMDDKSDNNVLIPPLMYLNNINDISSCNA